MNDEKMNHSILTRLVSNSHSLFLFKKFEFLIFLVYQKKLFKTEA